MLLLASLGREASDFNELAEALVGAGYSTIAVDGPGIGASDPAPEGSTLFDLAGDIGAVLAAERIDRLSMIGHAFGNRLARAFATRFPARVERLVLIAAGGRRPIPGPALAALMQCFNTELDDEAHGEQVRLGFFADGGAIPAHWRRGWHPTTAAIQSGAVRATPVEQWWHGGICPIAVLQADGDRIAPREDSADVLAAEFPDRVTVSVIADAGHAMLPEQPDAVAAAVLAALD